MREENAFWSLLKNAALPALAMASATSGSLVDELVIERPNAQHPAFAVGDGDDGVGGQRGIREGDRARDGLGDNGLDVGQGQLRGAPAAPPAGQKTKFRKSVSPECEDKGLLS